MIAFGYRKYTSLMHSVSKIMLEMGDRKASKDFLKNFLEICDVSSSKSVYMGERQFTEPLKYPFSANYTLYNKEEQNSEYPKRITYIRDSEKRMDRCSKSNRIVSADRRSIMLHRR